MSRHPGPNAAIVVFLALLADLSATAAEAPSPDVSVSLSVHTEIRTGAVFVSWRDAAGERDLAVRPFLENEGKAPLEVAFRAPATPGELLLGVFGMDARQGRWAAPLPVSFAPGSSPGVEAVSEGPRFEACVLPRAARPAESALPVAPPAAPAAESSTAMVPVALSMIPGIRTGAVFVEWADEGGRRTLAAFPFLDREPDAPLEFGFRAPTTPGDLRVWTIGRRREEHAFGHLPVSFAEGGAVVVEAVDMAVGLRAGQGRRLEMRVRR